MSKTTVIAPPQSTFPRHLRVVLASRSPQRRELLSLIVPKERIEVLPPINSEEAGFEGLTTFAEIEQRLLEIAQQKNRDVQQQWGAGTDIVVLAADTVVVIERAGQLQVLGQPPEHEPEYGQTVRDWFRSGYFGRTHTVLTGVYWSVPDDPARNGTAVARSQIRFRADGEQWLDWYLSTGEPRGKAGGYAIQGAGSVFVESITGSLSNIIGLPLESLIR